MKTFLGLVIALTFAAGMAFADESAAKEQAQKSGQQWLETIDAGTYAGSYDSSAAMFKTHVTKEQWVSALSANRTPLGKLVSRNIASATYATSLPGVPDGEYVVMQFNSSFEHKKQAVETLTMVLEKDGQWRNTGYFMK